MLTSYESLIADHDEIDGQVRILVADLAVSDRADAEKVAQTFDALACLVRRHIDSENAVMDSMAGREAAAAWGADWESVRSSFEDLRIRWLAFLDYWNVARIDAEWPKFRLEARSVLSHLKEQVTRETDLFYSAALRVGAIALRN